jgi:hypothetical protein
VVEAPSSIPNTKRKIHRESKPWRRKREGGMEKSRQERVETERERQRERERERERERILTMGLLKSSLEHKA